jgi:flavin reductase (DIM6/NTAB) family NADH-FMN oxidoreductase RutF
MRYNPEVNRMTEARFDSRAYRNALGRFATGVTVVTTAVDGGVHGMTANAFTSVSLDPPLILIAVGKQARMHTYLSQQGRFGVSVLSQDQLAYAWNFAGRPQEGFQPAFKWRGEVPLVTNALAHFVCSVETTHPGGDHTLFLSRVNDLWSRDGSPLTFYRGRFFGLIALPAGEWAPGAEVTAEPKEHGELSLEPWW